MQHEEIQQLIEAGLPGSLVMVDGDGTHFTTAVISSAFMGKSRVEKQQMVHAALRAHLDDGRLHAISIKTFTPEEWQQQLAKTV